MDAAATWHKMAMVLEVIAKESKYMSRSLTIPDVLNQTVTLKNGEIGEIKNLRSDGSLTFVRKTVCSEVVSSIQLSDILFVRRAF